MHSKQIKLSILIFSYNSLSYLQSCIESILQQDILYSYEVIIGDDASTDGTQVYLNTLTKKCPDLPIYVIQQKTNQYNNDHGSHRSVYAAAKGEYICHVDGDDLCGNGKFNKLVEYMDRNTDCFMSHHKVGFIRNGKITGYSNYPFDNKKTTAYDFFSHTNSIYSSSVIIRRANLIKYGQEFSSQYLMLDYIWWATLFINSNKTCGYVDEVLGYYRCGIGVMSNPLFLGRAINTVTYLDSLMGRVQDLNFHMRMKLISRLYSNYLIMMNAYDKHSLSNYRQIEKQYCTIKNVGFVRVLLINAPSLIAKLVLCVRKMLMKAC